MYFPIFKKNHKIIRFIILLILSSSLFASNKISYNINIELDADDFEIKGLETINYTNCGNFQIDSIYFQLVPNAFREPSSDYYQEHENLIDEPCFTNIAYVHINGQSVEYYGDNSIAMTVIPRKPILPQDSVIIEIKFSTKLSQGNHYLCPTHSQNKYFLINFYPEINFSFQEGWKPQIYQNIETMRHEFADYTFSITLPENFSISGSLPQDTTLFLDSDLQLIRFKKQYLRQIGFRITKKINSKAAKLKDQKNSLLATNRGGNDRINYLLNDILKYYNEYLDFSPVQQITIVSARIPMTYGYSNFILMPGKYYLKMKNYDQLGVHSLASHIAEQYITFQTIPEDSIDIRLNKGLANFLAEKYLSERYYLLKSKYDVPENFFTKNINKFLDLMYINMSIEDLNKFSGKNNMGQSGFLPAHLKYYRTQKIFQMLEYGIGDSLFQVILSAYLNQNQYLVSRTSDLFSMAESASGRDFQHFYNFWVNSDSIPDLSITNVRKSFSLDKNEYRAKVFLQNIPECGLPIEISASDSRKNLLTKKDVWLENNPDTVSFSSKYPIKKVTLDPQKKIWENNRINNKYPRKIIFRPFNRLPSIDSYQIFYHPTFDFNQEEIMQIGMKFQGRSWINLRPILPAQSLDDWSIGLNYGINSKRVGYQVGYSTSLLSLFFKPRIKIKIKDYYGVNKSTLASEIYIGKIQYFGLHRLMGYKKLTSGVKYENVQTLEFLNPDKWEKGKTVVPFIDLVNFHNWGKYRHTLHIKADVGIPLINRDFIYQKLSIDAQFKFHTIKRAWIYQRFYFGIGSDDIPKQENFYFFGKNILENLTFESYRLAKGAGDMRGYGGRGFKGTNIITGNTEVRWNLAGISDANFDILVFYDAGILPKTLKKLPWDQVKHNLGFGLEFNISDIVMVGLNFPVWVSDAAEGKERLDFSRWLITYDFTL